jgi:hypothetical protein
MTVEELREQADAICARYREREEPLQAELPRDDSPEAFERVGELPPQLAILLREQVGELTELDAPRELGSSWRENLDRLTRSGRGVSCRA